MQKKRATDAQVRDLQIAQSNVLVILPKQREFLVPVQSPEDDDEPPKQSNINGSDSENEDEDEDVVSVPDIRVAHYEAGIHDFVQKGVDTQYDFLELHSFHNPAGSAKMRDIYESHDMKIEGLTSDDYSEMVESANLQPLLDVTGAGGTYTLPHVNDVIAAFYSTIMGCQFGETTVYPSIRFVTQDSLLSCFLLDSARLGKFIASNFNIILEAIKLINPYT